MILGHGRPEAQKGDKKMKKQIFKVSCEFFVEATDTREVERYLAEEAGEFAEKHLLVDPAKEADDIYIKL